uniref:Uncharacterized protein n=1 Tax=Glossina palpalis gambiensis TaxID=67801 RepID=A0A1B0AQB0_9MUSC
MFVANHNFSNIFVLILKISACKCGRNVLLNLSNVFTTAAAAAFAVSSSEVRVLNTFAMCK